MSEAYNRQMNLSLHVLSYFDVGVCNRNIIYNVSATLHDVCL